MKLIYLTIVFATCIISISCSRKVYYNSVKSNTRDFDLIVLHLQNNRYFELTDTIELNDKTVMHLNSKCLYDEEKIDSLLLKFMIKYDLERICFHKNKQDYYDSVIIFHKIYNPIWGKATTISYDFGSSKLRNRIKAGENFPNHTISIINDRYIFLSNSKPAFGE